MHEQSKSAKRRFHDGNFHYKYFQGHGLDIGAGTDCLETHKLFFAGIKSVDSWDLPQGDAQLLATVADNTYDFVHSSHCLEHMVDYLAALKNWIRVVKAGGYLVITIPEEHMYEHNSWPSKFNYDHKWSFTLTESQLPKSVNVLSLLQAVAAHAKCIKLELIHEFYNPQLAPNVDQTMGPNAECAFEIVLQKL